MSEEILRNIEEIKKEIEMRYIKVEGMLEGVRLRKLGQLDKMFLPILEVISFIWKSVTEWTISWHEQHVYMAQKVNNLETKVSELEKDILQLRQTLDKMVQDK